MWADPSQDTCGAGWQYNKASEALILSSFRWLQLRNASWMFGHEPIRDFCRLLDVDLIVRAHEAVKDGHQFHGARNQLCTVFSAPNYCGIDGNCASVLRVSAELECSFVTLRPLLDAARLSAEGRAALARQAQAAEVKSPHPSGGHLPAVPPPPVVSPPTTAEPKETPTPLSDSGTLTSYTPSTKTG
ncbi:Serine/threonine-protein phosphatase [Aphelenchoides fujianensis]|nr:Serine/threonine-protein phosphatase [Aphelenchoides fujianensis]